ncbi:MAG: zinc ribbon domain-containing protein [Prevotella sp.]|nr:zinc ribbon domain-containing protein [Prevotella sp.]
MAMIKCPECGRQISDKAPVCPNCGVEIAGKIIKCPECGEIYFRDEEMCPNCHHLTRLSGTVGRSAATQQSAAQQSAPRQPISFQQSAPQQSAASQQQSAPQRPAAQQPVAHQSSTVPPRQRTQVPPTPPKKPTAPVTDKSSDGNKPRKSHTPLIVGLVFALLVCGICFYFYNNAKSSKEEEAYEFAMKSDDPIVLQTYLDNYRDAPESHISAVTARLDAIQHADDEWNNAVVSGTRQALLDYISSHPDSEHKAEAERKIDSIDWSQAETANTIQAIQAYLDEHANGDHVDEAQNALRQLKASTVQPEEKTMVRSVLRRFFQAINSRNEANLEAAVAPLMTSFLGKADATQADAVTFMDKIYKDDITNMNWRLGNDLKIDKKEIGDEQYEYSVSFSATQDIERTDPNKEHHANYKVKAVINPDQQISSLNMTKILE